MTTGRINQVTRQTDTRENSGEGSARRSDRPRPGASRFRRFAEHEGSANDSAKLGSPANQQISTARWQAISGQESQVHGKRRPNGLNRWGGTGLTYKPLSGGGLPSTLASHPTQGQCATTPWEGIRVSRTPRARKESATRLSQSNWPISKPHSSPLIDLQTLIKFHTFLLGA